MTKREQIGEPSEGGNNEVENTRLSRAREVILHMPLSEAGTYDEETIRRSFGISTPEERKTLKDIFTCIAVDDRLSKQQEQFLLDKFRE